MREDFEVVIVGGGPVGLWLACELALAKVKVVVLERRTSRARTIWTGIAVLAVLASFSLPLFAGVSTSTKVTLAIMHVAVAAVLIPAMRRGSRPLLAA